MSEGMEAQDSPGNEQRAQRPATKRKTTDDVGKKTFMQKMVGQKQKFAAMASAKPHTADLSGPSEAEMHIQKVLDNIRRLEEHNHKLLEEKSNVDAKLKELQEIHANCQNTQHSLEKYELACAKVVEENKKLKHENNTLANENRNLRKDRLEFDHKIDRLNSSIDTLVKENDELQNKLADKDGTVPKKSDRRVNDEFLHKCLRKLDSQVKTIEELRNDMEAILRERDGM